MGVGADARRMHSHDTGNINRGRAGEFGCKPACAVTIYTRAQSTPQPWLWCNSHRGWQGCGACASANIAGITCQRRAFCTNTVRPQYQCRRRRATSQVKTNDSTPRRQLTWRHIVAASSGATAQYNMNRSCPPYSLKQSTCAWSKIRMPSAGAGAWTRKSLL